MKLSHIESKIFGKVCYGFQRDKNGIVETVPEKAAIVKKTFLLFLDGSNLEEIQRYLFDRRKAK